MQRVVLGNSGAGVEGKFYSNARHRGIVDQRLGQIDYGADGSFYDEQTGYVNPPQTSVPISAGGASGGGLTQSEAALISAGITTTGALVNKALTPVPTVTTIP